MVNSSASFPKLIDNTGNSYPISGRIVTIGSSRDCHIRINDSSVPPLLAHLLFTDGSYKFHLLAKNFDAYINESKSSSNRQLLHNDVLTFRKNTFRYLEREEVSIPEFEASNSHGPLSYIGDLVQAIVSLLKNRDEDVFIDLVSSVAKLLRCDASRLVIEDSETGVRRTIARYPQNTGLDRFSDRAIDWARESSRAVLVNDSQWQESGESMSSLEKNLVASVMCAPLMAENQVLGYLYLDRLRDCEPFTEEDRKFCDDLLPLFSEILVNYEERVRQKETIARLQDGKLQNTGDLLYSSEVMSDLLKMAGRIARTESPVLITGETGTGKELMARFFHSNSSRGSGPFKAINCGAIPEQLMESELFGHEKGAFTGATQRKVGLFEASEGGTLFLDEIGEMPLQLQVKLLRVLQESEITRVGGTATLHVNVRIVAATNRELEQEITKGRFRQDLFFRLNVLTMQLPPLRERNGDIELLADYFIKKYCLQFGFKEKSLSSSAKNLLNAYQWPGNIRELENVIQKVIVLTDNNKINAEGFSFLRVQKTDGNNALASVGTLKDVRIIAERDAITVALKKTRGNVSLASRVLDIDRKWLIKKMEEFGIEAELYKES